jgi:hypothetical protein
MKAFKQMSAAEGKPKQFKLPMTADQLEQMAEFKPLPTEPTTTALPPPSSLRILQISQISQVFQVFQVSQTKTPL